MLLFCIQNATLKQTQKTFPGRKRSSEGKEIHPAPPETFIKAKSTVRDFTASWKRGD